MTRSRNSRKGSIGKGNADYWSRRPYSGATARSCRRGVSTKTLTHRAERRRAKAEEQKIARQAPKEEA